MTHSCCVRCVLSVAFTASIWLQPPIGFAQVTQTQPSIEWLVAQSDTIVGAERSSAMSPYRVQTNAAGIA